MSNPVGYNRVCQPRNRIAFNRRKNSINVGLLFTALFGVLILSGLFAIFISTRTWHWSVRATILIISGLPLLLVDAGELTLVLLASQLSIFLVVQFENARLSKLMQSGDPDTGRLFFLPNFKLVDLFLVLALASAIMALISQVIPNRFDELVQAIGIGVAIGIWSSSGICLAYWKFPWRKKTGLVLLGVSAALIWATLEDPWFGRTGKIESFVFWLVFLFIVATFVLLMFWLSRRSTFSMALSVPRPSRTGGGKLVSWMATIVLLIIAFCFAGSTMICFVWLLMPPKLSQPSRRIVEGQPNGFAELSDAGSEFGKSPYLSTSIPINPGKVLRDEVAAFAATFDKLDVALSRSTITCIDLTALDPDKDSILDMAIMDSIQEMRGVARALSIKARQEIHDGNYDAAMDDGLRCIKASRCLNDCILVTHLVGIACEGIGSYPISLALENATTVKLKEAANTLQEIDAESMPLEQILVNDNYYVWRLNDWKMRLFWGAHQLKISSPQSEQLVAARARRDAIRGQLRAAIALELYKRDHGFYPDELENLVPVYLNEVLGDPFSVETPLQPLRYIRVLEDEYKLYSVSLDGVDHGGVVTATGWQEGDLNHAANARQSEKDYRQEVEERKRVKEETSNDQN